jgi:hypothetical protein
MKEEDMGSEITVEFTKERIAKGILGKGGKEMKVQKG